MRLVDGEERDAGLRDEIGEAIVRGANVRTLDDLSA